MLALLIAIALASPEIPQGYYCRMATQMRDLNLPANRSDAATEVKHADIISQEHAFVGVLYQTRGGVLWYQDGLINAAERPSNKASTLALQALGVRFAPDDVGKGALDQVDGLVIQRLMDARLSLDSCF